MCAAGGLEFVRQEFKLVRLSLTGDCAIAVFDLDDEFILQGKTAGGKHRSLAVFTRLGESLVWVAGQTVKLYLSKANPKDEPVVSVIVIMAEPPAAATTPKK